MDCNILSYVTSKIRPKENILTIERYEYPRLLILSLFVCALKNAFVPIAPNIANTIDAIIASNTALSAVTFALSFLPSPSNLESNAFTPTPVPTDTAIISICIGYAKDTAASASGLYLATNMLSTIL